MNVAKSVAKGEDLQGKRHSRHSMRGLQRETTTSLDSLFYGMRCASAASLHLSVLAADIRRSKAR